LLEILIIICLALSLFLLLRHYPEVSKPETERRKMKISSIFSRFNHLKRERKPSFLSRKEVSFKSDTEILPEMIEEPIAVKEEDFAGIYGAEIGQFLKQAEIALEMNDLREAERLSVEAISKNKRCKEAYLTIGKVALLRGEFSDAKEAFKTCLKCAPDFPEACFYLGQAEFRQENYFDAIDCFQKAINLKKGVALWYAEIGKAYMEVRQYAKAAKSLKKASSLDIDNKDYRDLASEAEDKQRSHSYYSRLK